MQYSDKMSFLFLLIPFSLIAVVYLSSKHFKSSDSREIDSALPSVLFHIASMPSGTPIEKILSEIANAKYGALSKRFLFCSKEISRGFSVSSSLARLSKKNDSKAFQFVSYLLLEHYKKGSDITSSFREIASDLLEFQSIERETISSLSLQKYTLLASACFLVPAILGILFNFSSSLDFELSPFIITSQENLYQAVLFSNQLYLVEFSVITSLFISLQEGNKRKAIFYVLLILPISLIIFNSLKEFRFF